MRIENIGIIQARVGSTRLPNKMLMKIGRHQLIEWVIKRAKKIKNLDLIVLATSKFKQNDILEKIAKKNKIEIFRGSENDVLQRYISAATKFNKKVIVRLPADNPFIDSYLINKLINEFNYKKYEYSNNIIDFMNSKYVDGFGAEIFTLDLLKKIKNSSSQDLYKEHVTLYLKDYPKKFRIKKNFAPKEYAYPNLKFDIDTLEDLKKIRKIVYKQNVNLSTSAKEIINKYIFQ